MLVQDIMDLSNLQLYEDELATKARSALRSRGLRILPVVDEEGKIIGIVDREDVVKALL